MFVQMLTFIEPEQNHSQNFALNLICTCMLIQESRFCFVKSTIYKTYNFICDIILR